jgi:hypothetical protein
MKNRVYIVMLFCLSLSAIFCGCAEDASNGGKSEPMLFSAEICNRTQTRAAVDTTKHLGTNMIVSAAEPAKGITLNVSKMTRTSTSDGYWPSGANIAVQQGGTTKRYTVDGSGNITSSSPFYWANKNDITVTSWFPYSASLPTTWSVNSDQSTKTNYDGSDLLYASNTFTYDAGKSNTLKYSHETAKIVVNVTRPGYASDPSNITSITIGTSSTPINLSGAVESDGSITANSATSGYIIPYSLTPDSNYSATYSALVIPQNMQNKQFIAIKVYNTTYYYKPTISTPLLGGHEYDYNITIPIEYYFSDGTWGILANNSNKTPIGIVFSKKTSTIDQAHGWTHGYAMALTNASTSEEAWCTSISYDEAGDTYGSFTYSDYAGSYTSFIADKDGYSETQAIKNSGKDTYSQNSYPAFWYALNYGTSNENNTTYMSPPKSSGWFLPSIGQWWDIIINLGGISPTPTAYNTGICHWYPGEGFFAYNYKYSQIFVDNLNADLSATNNSELDLFAKNTYSSSSEANSSYSYHLYLGSEGCISLDDETNKIAGYYIRPSIAF